MMSAEHLLHICAIGVLLSQLIFRMEVAMTKSEQLLSAFSEDYFFKELVFDELCYTPANSTEVELADLIINLDDFIIAIQLKERNTADQTSDELKEHKWLEKKCRIAKGQVKETLRLISSGAIPSFQNKRGQEVALRADAKIIPLVVFENAQIAKYPHLLKKHSEDGVDINCMSFDDYVEMCRSLISPMEIVRYCDCLRVLTGTVIQAIFRDQFLDFVFTRLKLAGKNQTGFIGGKGRTIDFNASRIRDTELPPRHTADRIHDFLNLDFAVQGVGIGYLRL